MPTQILAVGNTAANSSDQTVSPGTTLTVCLKDADGVVVANGAQVEIQLKDDAGQYFTIATLTGGRPGLVIAGAGVYRFARKAGASCGVFSG